jgi:hypothetical protein
MSDLNSASNPAEQKPAEHVIGHVINTFLHRAQDVFDAAKLTIPITAKMQETHREQLKRQFDEGVTLLKESSSIGEGIRKTQSAIVQARRLSRSDLPETIEGSLFLGLFSAFEAYTGNLLTAIYRKKPELFRTINRSVAVAEILGFKSFEELQNSVLDEEIEDLRRKSYIEQFKHLESRFSISLTKFDNWPAFVECAQRRNLYTHCDARVSEQYLQICKQEGYEWKELPQLGTRLTLGASYFFQTCDLLMEVALKLGQTLWRKLFPNELGEADSHLNGAVYDALHLERWKRAQVFGHFAIGQKNFSTDVIRRMAIINYVIALKFDAQEEDANKQLSSVDWTASSNDFKLAEAVLLDRFEVAASIMQKIGVKGDYVCEESYHAWPLFRRFRASEPFLVAYQNIYQHPFTVELQKSAQKAQTETPHEA